MAKMHGKRDYEDNMFIKSVFLVLAKRLQGQSRVLLTDGDPEEEKMRGRKDKGEGRGGCETRGKLRCNEGAVLKVKKQEKQTC